LNFHARSIAARLLIGQMFSSFAPGIGLFKMEWATEDGETGDRVCAKGSGDRGEAVRRGPEVFWREEQTPTEGERGEAA
jgi:hypothetical protein